MNSLLWLCPSEEATLRFAETIGRSLIAPAWVGLCGELGTGKTRLAQGLARGLGYAGRVKSPTFVLEQRYRGRVPIFHLDLYRVEAAGEEFQSLWEENADEAVILVEWAEKVAEPPRGALWLHLTAAGELGRWIRLSWQRQGAPVRDLCLGRRTA